MYAVYLYLALSGLNDLCQVLYNKDCLSDQAIIYWYQKGSKPQGRQHFLKSTEPLVKVCEILNDIVLPTYAALHLVPTGSG